MILIEGFVLAMICSLVIWVGVRPMLERPVFRRTNYRSVDLATAGGLVIPVAVFFTGALIAVLSALGVTPSAFALTALQLTSIAVGGFGLLGLLDDLAVDEGTSGYRGHLIALFSGRLSAGSLKMVAGPAIALVVVQPASGDSFAWLVIDGAVVALAANLANLFDRAPGRVTKVASLCLASLVIGSIVGAGGLSGGVLPGLFGAAVVLGAAWGLMRPEMREEMMLGDTGANPMGAALGLAVVLTQSQAIRLGVLGALVVLNLLSERVSFSSVIERVPVLRWIDQLGRRPLDR